jgi:uncharacterized protein (TIRG00374 family)
MTESAKKYAKFILRWGVAIAGAWYVLAQLSWSDRVLAVFDASNQPHWASVIEGDENSPILNVRRWDTDQVQKIDQDAVVNEPDRKNMTVLVSDHPAKLLGVELVDRDHASRLLVQQDNHPPAWVTVDQTNYQVTIPHARIQIGVRHLVASARQSYLWLAIALYPLNFLITTFRWRALLKALDIRLPIRQTFILNMVGAFYNTFMLGSTGGDVVKAYYVAKQTHHRTRAVMSVIVDRVIGLLALIILGGAMATLAAVYWHIAQARNVACASLAILCGTALGLTLLYHEDLHRRTGLGWIMARLPMQAQVRKAIEAMHLYRQQPKLAAAALVASFPVHCIVIITAMFAGVAFGLHIPLYFYWTVVPVTVLVGSIPISPQGAGVMEYFAIVMLAPLGCTVAEAVALTMSIRLLQILWNLSGSVFIFAGGYHSPTVKEERQIEAEDEDRSGDQPPTLPTGQVTTDLRTAER